MVFRRRITSTDYDLFSRSIAGFAPAKVLVEGATVDADPTYSPDGTRIAFKRETSVGHPDLRHRREHR